MRSRRLHPFPRSAPLRDAPHKDAVESLHVLLCELAPLEKMSKSLGNVGTPIQLFDEQGVDAVRYWAASARLEADIGHSRQCKVVLRETAKLTNV